MSIRVVPEWAKWAVIIGVFGPILGAFGMKSYNPSFSFIVNAQIQTVELPFFRGQNPLVCINESIRMMASAVVVEDVQRSYGCAKSTQLPYRYIFIASMVAFLLGLYRIFNPVALVDKWPTEWRGGSNIPAKQLVGKPNVVKPDIPDGNPESGG